MLAPCTRPIHGQAHSAGGRQLSQGLGQHRLRQAMGSQPLVMETLQALLRTLANHGERPALIAVQKHDVAVWSFTRIVDLAQRLAVGFAEAGLERGTHALLLAPNRPE